MNAETLILRIGIPDHIRVDRHSPVDATDVCYHYVTKSKFIKKIEGSIED